MALTKNLDERPEKPNMGQSGTTLTSSANLQVVVFTPA